MVGGSHSNLVSVHLWRLEPLLTPPSGWRMRQEDHMAHEGRWVQAQSSSLSALMLHCSVPSSIKLTSGSHTPCALMAWGLSRLTVAPGLSLGSGKQHVSLLDRCRRSWPSLAVHPATTGIYGPTMAPHRGGQSLPTASPARTHAHSSRSFAMAP